MDEWKAMANGYKMNLSLVGRGGLTAKQVKGKTSCGCGCGPDMDCCSSGQGGGDVGAWGGGSL